jgi:hypothetical protein
MIRNKIAYLSILESNASEVAVTVQIMAVFLTAFHNNNKYKGAEQSEMVSRQQLE